MTKRITILTMSVLLVGSAALAEDQVNPASTHANEANVTRGVYESPLNVTARTGVLGFKDTADSNTSRILEGLSLNWNLTNMSTMDIPLQLGFEAGLLFSHLGSVGSNFIGTNGNGTGSSSAINTAVFPLTFVLGFKPNYSSLLALNLGTNAIYQNNSSTMNVGRPGASGTGSSTEFFPSIGFTAGYSLARFIGLTLRGDYIPTPVSNMFTASLGATFPLA